MVPHYSCMSGTRVVKEIISAEIIPGEDSAIRIVYHREGDTRRYTDFYDAGNTKAAEMLVMFLNHATQVTDALEQAQADLGKCRESRLAETIRDLPEVKAAFERVEQLEAALNDVISLYLNPHGLGAEGKIKAAHSVATQALQTAGDSGK